MPKKMFLKILKTVFIMSIIIILLIFFIFEEYKPIILGYIFGVCINVLSFKLMENNIIKALELGYAGAKKQVYSGYFMRILIYFVVLLISAIADYLNVLSAFVGLCMVKNSILLLSKFDKNFISNQ